MDIIEVNKETCLRDGICAAICPPGIIDFQPDDYPKPATEAEEVCIKCGHCVAVCPTGSLSHREMPVEECPPVPKSLKLDIKDFENFLKSRRSIRVYEDRPVPQEVITRLIEIARYSPSGRNSQSVAWLVFHGREEMRRLRDIGAGWMRWMLNSKLETPLIPDIKRMLECYESGGDEFLRYAPVLVIAHDSQDNPIAAWNCAIALTNFELAANCMGLGCCCIGFVLHAASDYPPFAEALAIPEGNKAYGCIIVGYPKYKYQRLPLRQPPRITWRQ